MVTRRNDLHRNKKQRASYDRALIVCEGSKTEPLYFGEIRSEYRLHTANIQIRPSEYGTSPLQVVQYAHDLFINGDPHRDILPRDFDHLNLAKNHDADDGKEPYTNVHELIDFLVTLRS